jgi:phage-related protein
VEVQVDFTNLGDTEEYKQYKDLQKVYLYDLVRVNDPNVGLNLQLQVSQTQFDCIAERYVGIRVGNVFDYGGRTVFGYNIGDDAIAYEKISLEAVRKIQSGVNTNNN